MQRIPDFSIDAGSRGAGVQVGSKNLAHPLPARAVDLFDLGLRGSDFFSAEQPSEKNSEK
jgi:hypothetical protein